VSSQVLREQSSAVRSFAALLRAYSRLTRELNTQLLAEHELTINDYEVLLHLARAPERRLRRVDLSERVVLTASGITRLLEGLEQNGLVERHACDSDRRVAYAVLTDAGLDRLRTASRSHVAQIEALFAEALGEQDQAELAGLLERLCSGGDAGDCTVD
jgi:DNA-binding MarR family transcriptional regulator